MNVSGTIVAIMVSATLIGFGVQRYSWQLRMQRHTISTTGVVTDATSWICKIGLGSQATVHFTPKGQSHEISFLTSPQYDRDYHCGDSVSLAYLPNAPRDAVLSQTITSPVYALPFVCFGIIGLALTANYIITTRGWTARHIDRRTRFLPGRYPVFDAQNRTV